MTQKTRKICRQGEVTITQMGNKLGFNHYEMRDFMKLPGAPKPHRSSESGKFNFYYLEAFEAFAETLPKKERKNKSLKADEYQRRFIVGSGEKEAHFILKDSKKTDEWACPGSIATISTDRLKAWAKRMRAPVRIVEK